MSECGRVRSKTQERSIGEGRKCRIVLPELLVVIDRASLDQLDGGEYSIREPSLHEGAP